MELVSLEAIVKNIYDNRVIYIRNKNIELEREYFTVNSSSIPLGEIMIGTSFEDHFQCYKEVAKKSNKFDINRIFELLKEYFLFSYGHDMMYKKKLEADIFTSIPIDDLIYPRLLEAIKEKYNDVSVIPENPNYKENIENIDKLVFTYLELQSLLNLLYCYDFQFPNGWENLYPDTYKDIICILDKSGMTIGDYLHALIDFKCKIMNEVLSEIEDAKLRDTYLKKVETLSKEKHVEARTFAHVDMPVTYFLDHSIMDFSNQAKNNSEQKIIINKK